MRHRQRGTSANASAAAPQRRHLFVIREGEEDSRLAPTQNLPPQMPPASTSTTIANSRQLLTLKRRQFRPSTTTTTLLLLALALAIAATPPGGAHALKLPAFLSSWMTSEQSPAQLQKSTLPANQQVNQLALGTQLAGSEQQQQQVTGNSQASKARAAILPLKRPFQGYLNTGSATTPSGHKYPGAHLFQVLPKSFFGRFLSGAGGVATLSQQQQQRAPIGEQFPVQQQQSQQQQQQPQQQFTANFPHEQIMPLVLRHLPADKQLAALQSNPSLPAWQPFGRPPTQLPFKQPSYASNSNQHAITSFLPPPPPPPTQPAPMAQAKKHALGYGEPDDEFIIVNAAEFAPTAAPSGGEQKSTTTRHPSDEYREMPAIVIADPEQQINATTSLTPGEQVNHQTNTTTSAAAAAAPAGEVQLMSELIASHELSATRTNGSSLWSGGETINNSTAIATSDLATQSMDRFPDASRISTTQAVNLSSSEDIAQSINKTDILELPRNVTQQELPVKESTNASAPISEFESGRLESAASAVIVSSPMDENVNEYQLTGSGSPEAERQQEVESFIIGPFRGPDDLASAASATPQQQQQQSADFALDNQSQRQMVQAMMQHQQQQQQHHQHHHQQPQFAQFQAQRPATHMMHHQQPHRLIGSAASNLIHQATRHLIQMSPFSHTFMHPHQMVQHQRPQQAMHHAPQQLFGAEQQSDFMFGPQMSASNLRPNHNNNNFYPNSPTFMTSGPNHNFAYTQWTGNKQQFAPRPAQSAPTQFNKYQQVQHFRPPPSQQFGGMQAPPPPPPRPTGEGFNLVLNHASGSQPYFVQQQNQHFVQQARPTPQINNAAAGSNRLKAGLYQMEPPKLDTGSNVTAVQNKQQTTDEDGDDGDEDSANQQKIDVQEASGDEPGTGSGINDDDDQQQQQQLMQNVGDKKEDTQQSLTVVEPVLRNFNQSSPGVGGAQVALQVGAHFGVAGGANSTVNSTRFDHQQLPERKGQVFSEPALPVAQQPTRQHLPNELMNMFDFEQRQASGQLLDTQVYTLPFDNQQPRRFLNYQPQLVGGQSSSGQVHFTRPVQFQQPLRPDWSAEYQQRQPFVGRPQFVGAVQQPEVQQQQQYFHYQPIVETPAQHNFELAIQHQQQPQPVGVAPVQLSSAQLPVKAASQLEESAQDSAVSASTPASSTIEVFDSREQSNEVESTAAAQSTSSAADQKQVSSPSSFCAGRPAGLYADVEQRCKAYYQCAPTGHQMFRCNNQTQFNQKTQNCDWWYNVDCGGRLGSPEDFEQASTKSVVLDTSSEPLTTTTTTTTTARTTTVLASPGDRLTPSVEDNNNWTSTSDMIATSNNSTTLTTPSEQSNLGQIVSADSATAQQQQQQTLADDSTTPSPQTATPPANQLIEVAGEPRVGASASEVGHTPEVTTVITVNSTDPPVTSASLISKEPEVTTTTQASQVQPKSRRLIQSEFSGSSSSSVKSARAISALRQQRARQQQQFVSIGELSAGADPQVTSFHSTGVANRANQLDFEPDTSQLEFAHFGQVIQGGDESSTTQPSITSTAPAPIQTTSSTVKLARRFGARLGAITTTTTTTTTRLPV